MNNNDTNISNDSFFKGKRGKGNRNKKNQDVNDSILDLLNNLSNKSFDSKFKTKDKQNKDKQKFDPNKIRMAKEIEIFKQTFRYIEELRKSIEAQRENANDEWYRSLVDPYMVNFAKRPSVEGTHSFTSVRSFRETVDLKASATGDLALVVNLRGLLFAVYADPDTPEKFNSDMVSKPATYMFLRNTNAYTGLTSFNSEVYVNRTLPSLKTFVGGTYQRRIVSAAATLRYVGTQDDYQGYFQSEVITTNYTPSFTILPDNGSEVISLKEDAYVYRYWPNSLDDERFTNFYNQDGGKTDLLFDNWLVRGRGIKPDAPFIVDVVYNVEYIPYEWDTSIYKTPTVDKTKKTRLIEKVINNSTKQERNPKPEKTVREQSKKVHETSLTDVLFGNYEPSGKTFFEEATEKMDKVSNTVKGVTEIAETFGDYFSKLTEFGGFLGK